jgi:hypothetical protein
MPSPSAKPKFLELPSQRLDVQHQYTSSPSDRRLCTLRISHCFIPLGTSSPLPALGAGTTDRSAFDYFSLPKKETVIPSDAVKYQPHGLIPLCSVAIVEKGEEARDYFSHSLHSKIKNPVLAEQANAISPAAVPYEPHGFIPSCSVTPVENNNGAGDYLSYFAKKENDDFHGGDSLRHLAKSGDFHEGDSMDNLAQATDLHSSSKSPAILYSTSDFSPPLFVPTSHIPIADLTHPSGSPILERNISRWSRTPHVRSPDDFEDATASEKLSRLEESDESFEKKIAGLEETVSSWEGGPERASLYSTYSGSGYSRDTDDEGIEAEGIEDALCDSSDDEDWAKDETNDSDRDNKDSARNDNKCAEW